MAGRIALPQRFQQLTEAGQKPDTSYYRWFDSVEVTLRDLDGRVTVIEAEIAGGGGADFTLFGPASVDIQGTPASGFVQLQLVGDVISPGNIQYYGTNAAGAKGWYILSAMVPAPNTNRSFWRGDLTWANELEGPFSARALTDTATLGPELVTNGTFTGGLASWTAGAGWVGAANTAVVTVVGAGTLSQNIAVVSGQVYRVSWTQQHNLANNGNITATIGAASGGAISYGNTANNTQTVLITAAATGSIPLTFTVTGAVAGTITLDTVSVVNITEIPFTIEAENAAGAMTSEIRALASNTNTATGFNSGRSIISGTNNTFYGSGAGRETTTGNNNTFVGQAAGLRHTTGINNVCIGFQTGLNLTTGSNNFFLGTQAGLATKTGDSNAFLGTNSGLANTTGFNNTFIGSNSGVANTIAVNCVFVGFQSGLSNTTGNNNVAMGTNSLMNTTAGASNTGLGRDALLGNTTGGQNVGLGFQAGRFQADGTTALTDAENSVYIGTGSKGLNNADDNSIVVGFNAIGRGANTAQWGNTSIINHYFSGSIQYTGKVFVAAKSGFPAPVAGVITLANNTNYEVSGFIDLTGDRIVCGTNNAIFGQTADADGLVSTGLPGGSALITSTSSLELRNLRLSAPTGRIFDLNDGATNSLNWAGLQIIDTPTLGTIQNYANIVINQSIVNNSANLTLDGTIASFVSETSLWDGRAGQTTIIVPATAVFTRRFRMLYTAVSVQPGETGINFSAAATIPDESYILDNVSFTGGGTYLAGLTYTSNKANFFRCFGITNTNAICQYSMTANATATVIAAAGTFVKVAGTTTASALNQKFDTSTTQRALYTGAFPADFNVSVTASMRSGNNQNIRMRIAKNGVTIAESNSSFITTGAGDASAVPAQTLTSLIPTDFLEVFVTNDTAANNITVSDLNVIVRRLF